ncbi:unnamed protein product [Blepharisma stoltei]|uniref:LNR domain-containing protein n=1 Tax=Blepharisma stoltei TaxID=1481888 RepID=A0AAU9JJG9_9CILI|nr:unnamed protein product [Blepharisma stoltei]
MIGFTFIFWTFAKLAMSERLLCSLFDCPDSKKGNGQCDPACMTSYCNYDTNSSVNALIRKEQSDCYWNCIYIDGCKKEKLGNGVCDNVCNTKNCGYDWGDCGQCAPSCKLYLGTSAKLYQNCNPSCNVTSCYYGLGTCKKCHSGCFSNLLGNGVCNPECAYPECNFDLGDCKNLACAPGCYMWMIGNSICEEACRVAECNFDNYDCDCSPGCFESMLGDGKCDEACNNWNCTLDNHDCGACASGCYPEMLGNGICDSECNNYDCEYDYKDCQCSDGCTYLDYGKCKPECLVIECNYDKISQYPNSWCQNTSLAIFSSYQQIINRNFKYVAHLEDCYAASNYACSFDKVFDMINCFQECNITECNFANGNCNSTQSQEEDCARPYGDGSGENCLSCKTLYWWEQGCTRQLSYFLWHFPDGSLGINRLSDISTAKNPRIYFVSALNTTNFFEGDGTAKSPYRYFLLPIYFTLTTNAIVYLLDDGDYDLDWEESYYSSLHLGILNLGLTSRNYLFTPWNSSHVTIKFHDSYTILIEARNSVVEFRNIIVEGKGFLTCNSSIYCEYCPVVYANSDSPAEYYNDRHEKISEYLSSTWCAPYRNVYIINLKNTHLILTNVTIQNYRFGYKGIISASCGSNITMENVSFDNIKLSEIEDSAIIVYAYQDYCKTLPANLYYNHGKVSRLNNGYEFRDPINLRGFLYAPNITSIVIKHVEFEYNMIYQNPLNVLGSASLIELGWFETLVVDSCTFLYNYCELGIINIQNTETQYAIEFNESLILNYSTFTHLHIKNTSFISNYGQKNGILSANYFNETQNFLIESSRFISNGVESSSLLSIWSQTQEDEFINGKNINSLTSGGIPVTVRVLPRWLEIKNLTFTDNYSGGSGLIEIKQMANIEIKDTQMNENGGNSNESKEVNSIILRNYVNNDNIYLKLEAPNPVILSCKSMSIISASVNFLMQSINITDNYCANSSPAIIIDSTQESMIYSLQSERNTGKGNTGICLSFQNSYSASIKNSKFIGNKNYLSGSAGAIEFSINNALTLENCTFIENSADLGGALYFSGQNLAINGCHFISNQSPGLSGGAIYYMLPQTVSSYSELTISNTVFRNNSCLLNGGSIYINKKFYSSIKTSLSIHDTNFYENKAFNGASIHISNFIKLLDSSSINNCVFQANNASLSGSFSIFYADGKLSINNSKFIENKGLYSSALHISINEDSKNFPSRVILNSCIFQKNSGPIIILMDDENKRSILETHKCLFEYNLGSIFSLDNDTLVENDSIIQHGHSEEPGAGLIVINSAVAGLRNTIFYNNTSKTNGGVAALSYNSHFTCDFCEFKENAALNVGGVVYADSDSFFTIRDSKIIKNSSKGKGSAFSMIRCLSKISEIINCEISENQSVDGGALYLLSSAIALDSSIIHNNIGNDDNPGILMTFSSAKIQNTTFLDQHGSQGSFVQLKSNSYALIQNSKFSNGLSSSTGAAIFSISSNISVFNSFFHDLTSNIGGSIFVYRESYLWINDTTFENSKGSDIDSYDSFINIEHSLFINPSFSAIYGDADYLLRIENTEFRNGSGKNGGAIYCSKCVSLLIDSCLFSKNSASYSGGAVYLITEQSSPVDHYMISSSKFLNNEAYNGGAIFSENINLTIYLSEFTKNFADSLRSENNDKGVIDGIGGGIKLSCKDFDNCLLNLSSNLFSENKAINNGGAISWADIEPVFDNNSFQRNSATYGNGIASFPIMMFYEENRSGSNSPTRILENPTISGIASGQKNNKPMSFALVDHYNQVVKTDNISQAQLLNLNSDTILFGVTMTTALNGIFNFTDYVITAKPGTSTQIKIYTSAIKEAKGNSYSNSVLYANVDLRLCTFGEATVNITCLVCEESYYSLNPNNRACLQCPKHAICYGNYTMVPRHGYWRDNKYTDQFWACPYPSACLGSPDIRNISYTGVCKKGYKGNMCQSCAYGYSRLYKNECKVCLDSSTNAIRMLGFFGIFFIIALLTIKASKKYILNSSTFTSIYIKIFWNYLHITIIITTFNLNWPRWVMEFFYIELSMNYVGEQLFSFECLLQDSNAKIEIYYIKLVLISFVPLAAWTLCFILWALYYRLIKHAWRLFSDDFISSCIIVLFLIHPGIIETLFSIYSCREINSGEFWLNIDLDIQCWTKDHFFYSYLIVLPAILIWGIVIPATWLIKIIKYKVKLEETAVKLKYGFLYNGYNSKHYYWEFVILYCKILLISFSVFLSNISISVQALAATILLIFFLLLQNRNEPFVEKPLNKMELHSRVIVLITIFTGLFFLTDELGDPGTVLIFLITLCSNIWFIIYSLLRIFNELLKFVKEKLLFMGSILFRKSRVKVNYIIDESQVDDGKNTNLNYTYITSTRIINSAQEIEVSGLESYQNNESHQQVEIDPYPSENSAFTSQQEIK